MTVTKWIMLAVIVGGSIYDVWAALNKRKGDTFTEVARELVKRPMISLSCGVVIGHIWWCP